MTLYWWTHWFWITAIMAAQVSASPVPLSSFETISTSLKSALIQNENSFQQTNNQQKIATGTKSVPLTFETSDTDEIYGVTGDLDSENIAKNNDFISKSTNDNESVVTHVTLDKNQNIPSEIVASLTLPNVVNSTNNSTLQTSTTMLSSVTESDVIGSSIKTTTTQTTKLVKVNEVSPEEHILSVKTLNFTSSDVTESNQSDLNDTVEILMTDDANVTELTELSERKAKGLIGYSQEAKVLNNISSRSTLQVTHLSQTSPTTNDDRLSSEALFVTDEDNGGITMNAGIISLICVGIIGSLSAFSIMFVYVYRRRFLNKPQTLSEPDSSGYIDDSTIRDNSDELYSLDNDSFLNSLEAMTIQNYWTDSVKHTKL